MMNTAGQKKRSRTFIILQGYASLVKKNQEEQKSNPMTTGACSIKLYGFFSSFTILETLKNRFIDIPFAMESVLQATRFEPGYAVPCFDF